MEKFDLADYKEEELFDKSFQSAIVGLSTNFNSATEVVSRAIEIAKESVLSQRKLFSNY